MPHLAQSAFSSNGFTRTQETNDAMSVSQPDDRIKQLISESLHHAIQHFDDADAIAQIRSINTIGCLLLNHLTGKDYSPVAGSIEVRAGGQPFGVEAMEADASRPHYQWILGAGPDDEMEFVDFGARYWKQWAEAEGIAWNAEPPPNMVWELAAHIPEDLAVYTAAPDLSANVCKAIDEFIETPTNRETLLQWEDAVNDAVDYLMEIPEGVDYLVEAGIASWEDEEDGFEDLDYKDEDEEFEDEDNGARL